MERWTREQTIVALSLYWRIPYNQISGTNNHLIRETASVIGKSPAALAFKLMNLSSLDESRDHKANQMPVK
jgi:putative restriction endonuclease